MTVQELSEQLAAYQPDQPVHLVVTRPAPGFADAVYDIDSLAAGGTEENDVHLLAGVQVTC